MIVDSIGPALLHGDVRAYADVGEFIAERILPTVGITRHILQESDSPKFKVKFPYGERTLDAPLFTLDVDVLFSDSELSGLNLAEITHRIRKANAAMAAKEDRLLRGLLTSAAAHVYIGPMEPDAIASMQSKFAGVNLPVANLIVGSAIWNDIVCVAEFQHHYKPPVSVIDREFGLLGELYDQRVYTDGFYPEAHRVLHKDDAFAVAAPQHVGSVYREPAKATYVEVLDGDERFRGWTISRRQSMTIANMNAVGKFHRFPYVH